MSNSQKSRNNLPFTSLDALNNANQARKKLQKKSTTQSTKTGMSKNLLPKHKREKISGKKSRLSVQEVSAENNSQKKEFFKHCVQGSTVNSTKRTSKTNTKHNVIVGNKAKENTKDNLAVRRKNHSKISSKDKRQAPSKGIVNNRGTKKTKQLALFKHKVSRRRLLGGLILIATISAIFIVAYFLKPQTPMTLGANISLGNLDVSNLKRDDFVKLLQDNEQKLLASQQIEIKILEQKHPESIYNLSISLDADKIFETALKQEQERQDARSVYFWQPKPTDPLPTIDLPYAYKIDEERLNQSVDKLQANYNSEYGDAEVTGFDTEKREFIIKAETPTIILDKAKIITKIKQIVNNGMVTTGLLELPIEKYVEPKIKAEDLKNKLGYVSEAVSYLPYWSEGRNQNLRRVCELLQGYIIKPGTTLSYNEALGPQTSENGFAEGYAVQDGIAYLELGGGICQTSTVLYQAAVKANLDIVERHNHGEMIPYANYGQDAMVADWADLKISNNSEYPYAIYTNFDEDAGEIVFAIYGPAVENGETIDIISEKVKDIPASSKVEYRINKELLPGELKEIRERKDGSVWNSYKVYYKDGEEVRREYLKESTYDPFTQIYECYAMPQEQAHPNDTSQPADNTLSNQEPVND